MWLLDRYCFNMNSTMKVRVDVKSEVMWPSSEESADPVEDTFGDTKLWNDGAVMKQEAESE